MFVKLAYPTIHKTATCTNHLMTANWWNVCDVRLRIIHHNTVYLLVQRFSQDCKLSARNITNPPLHRSTPLGASSVPKAALLFAATLAPCPSTPIVCVSIHICLIFHFYSKWTFEVDFYCVMIFWCCSNQNSRRSIHLWRLRVRTTATVWWNRLGETWRVSMVAGSCLLS